jgi:hypothetical protein
MSVTVSATAAAILNAGSYRLTCRASVTRGGVIIADDVPIVGGREEFDDTLRVPERVVVTVPRVVDGVDWTPVQPEDPLSPYGQRLHVKLGVDIGADGTEWINRGEFLIHDTQPQGETLSVTAVGLLALIDEARLVTPYVHSGTFLSSLRGLLEPAITMVVDQDVVDNNRAVPSDLNEDEDRLKAVLDLLAAWPARAQMTPDGYLRVLDADSYPASTAHLQRYRFQTEQGDDDDNANVITVAGGLTREGLINTVVARGQASDGGQITGVRYDRTGGPTSLGSAFNPLPVPEFFFSPLITQTAQANTAAEKILRRRAGLAARRYDVQAVPDPRLLGNETIQYRPDASPDDGRLVPVIVEAFTLPYTADSGPARMSLREVPA